MALKLVTPPDGLPVSLDEAKRHLREDSDLNNPLIELMIAAVTDYLDGEGGILGRALLRQTWDYYIDNFPTSEFFSNNSNCWIELPLPPLISVIGIYYLDADGNEQTYDSSNYTVDSASKPARIQLKSGKVWPSASTSTINAIRIRFEAGYINNDSPPVENVPSAIKQAILLLLSNLYHNRETFVIGETVIELPWAAKQLLRLHNANKGFA